MLASVGDRVFTVERGDYDANYLNAGRPASERNLDFVQFFDPVVRQISGGTAAERAQPLTIGPSLAGFNAVAARALAGSDDSILVAVSLPLPRSRMGEANLAILELAVPSLELVGTVRLNLDNIERVEMEATASHVTVSTSSEVLMFDLPLISQDDDTLKASDAVTRLSFNNTPETACVSGVPLTMRGTKAYAVCRKNVYELDANGSTRLHSTLVVPTTLARPMSVLALGESRLVVAYAFIMYLVGADGTEEISTNSSRGRCDTLRNGQFTPPGLVCDVLDLVSLDDESFLVMSTRRMQLFSNVSGSTRAAASQEEFYNAWRASKEVAFATVSHRTEHVHAGHITKASNGEVWASSVYWGGDEETGNRQLTWLAPVEVDGDGVRASACTSAVGRHATGTGGSGESRDEGASAGAVAGIVIAVGAAVLLLVAVAVVLVRRRQVQSA